jgi:hypothetical protein
MVIRPAGRLRRGSKYSDVRPRPDQLRPFKPRILLTDASRLKCLGFAPVHTETVNGKERIRLVTCGSLDLASSWLPSSLNLMHPWQHDLDKVKESEN